MGLKNVTRRALSRRVSVADMAEFGLWLAIPYLLVGLAVAFFHVEQVRRLKSLIGAALPAGAEMAGYLLVAGLWPVVVLLPSICAG